VWIWSILFLGFLMPQLAKWLKANADTLRSLRTNGAWIALTLLVAYESGRFAMHARAVEMLESHTYEGAEPTQAIAVPADFVHPMKWKGIARTPGLVTIVPLDVQEAYDPSQEMHYEDDAPADIVAKARLLPDFQTMMRFSQAPFWKVTREADGNRVELMD